MKYASRKGTSSAHLIQYAVQILIPSFPYLQVPSDINPLSLPCSQPPYAGSPGITVHVGVRLRGLTYSLSGLPQHSLPVFPDLLGIHGQLLEGTLYQLYGRYLPWHGQEGSGEERGWTTPWEAGQAGEGWGIVGRNRGLIRVGTCVLGYSWEEVRENLGGGKKTGFHIAVSQPCDHQTQITNFTNGFL